MRTMRILAMIGFVLLPPVGMAHSVFDGTWRPDPEKFGPERQPDAAELVNGSYDCASCTPPYQVKADGQDQPVTGNPYCDTISIAVVDQRTIVKTAKKGGKTVMQTRVVVAADGKTQTERQTMYGPTQRPIEMTARYTRVAPGPKGSHLVSGAWRLTEADVSNHAEDTVFKVTGDVFSMSDRMGRSFSAKLDGTEAPYQGSEEFTAVSVKRIDSRTIEESDKNGGQVVKINRWTVDPDGKTIHARFDDTKGFVQEQTGHKVK